MSTVVIPAIDIIQGRCVRLSQGDYASKTVYDVDPCDMVRRFVDAGFPRVHVVDLDGAKAASPQNLATLEKVASVPGARIEWGGGIKDSQALTDIFSAGASYAVVGSIAARQPDVMARWIREYGPGRMILGADVRNGRVAVSGWQEEMQLTIEDLMLRLLPDGLTQVICTEISRDGMLAGSAVELYRQLMERFPQVIFTSSGGIGSLADVEEVAAAGVSRVIVGKALYEGRVTLEQLRPFAGDAV